MRRRTLALSNGVGRCAVHPRGGIEDPPVYEEVRMVSSGAPGVTFVAKKDWAGGRLLLDTDNARESGHGRRCTGTALGIEEGPKLKR